MEGCVKGPRSVVKQLNVTTEVWTTFVGLVVQHSTGHICGRMCAPERTEFRGEAMTFGC